MNKIKQFAILFALFATLWIGWRTYHLSSFTFEESKNVFDSSLYTHYRKKIKNFALSHPLYDQMQKAPSTVYNTKVKELIEVIEKLPETSSEQRAYHLSFTHALREIALITPEGKDEEQVTQKFFEDLLRWLFLEVDLKPEMQSFLYEYVNPPTQDFFAYLQENQKRLHDHPQFDGIKQSSSFEDQFLHGNLPSFVVLIHHHTQLIRMGQPIYRSSHFWPEWFSLQVSPEFLLFLQKQPSHFYVNLMKRKGVEAPYTHSLEALEKQCENLYLITLDKNSSFYWQEKEKYSDFWESANFKEAFLNELCSRQGNYFWSKHLNPSLWKQELKQIMNAVHQSFFHHAQILDRKERQDFIEITYVEILNHLTEKWQPSSMNITCRQGMDRGPSLMVLWLLQKEILGKEEMAALLLAPPLMLHNRASHSSKIERLISAAQRLERTQDL
jgi:hypothetical protein